MNTGLMFQLVCLFLRLHWQTLTHTVDLILNIALMLIYWVTVFHVALLLGFKMANVLAQSRDNSIVIFSILLIWYVCDVSLDTLTVVFSQFVLKSISTVSPSTLKLDNADSV